MQRFLLVLTVVLFCFRCKSDAEENLNNVLSEFKPTIQVFEIRGDTLAQIKADKGTVLHIQSGAFTHQNGSLVDNEIEIHLLELTSTEDLLRANAQTVSNGKWLISGGAYHIKAFSENKLLKLADGKTIVVSFPKISSEEMELFSGSRDVDGNLNWTASNQVLKSRKYPVVIQKDSSFLRFDMQFAIDMLVDSTVFRRLKEKYSVIEIQKKHQEIDSLIAKNDTLFAYVFSRRDIWSEIPLDSLLYDVGAKELVKTKKATRENIFEWELFRTISISKLGWINVDRFYPEIRNRVSFEMLPNIDLDAVKYYAADNSNNTLLNLFENEEGKVSFEAPIGKRFTIIAFGIKEEQVYGYKKSVLIEKKTKHQIVFRKADKNTMETYFKLN